MKQRHALLAVCLAALAWAWAQRSAPQRSLSFRFELARAAEGVVSVEARVPALGPLRLRGLLSDALLGLSDLRATDEAGVELPVVREPDTVPGPEGKARRFTRFVVDPGPARSIRLSYEVSPGTYLPPAGDNEFRRCGVVSARGCALSLANLLLVPEGPAARLELEAALPATWSAPVALPPAVRSADRALLWDAALVAGEYAPAALAPTPSLRVRLPLGTPAEVVDALATTARALEEILGAPSAPVEVVVAVPRPVDGRGGAPEPVELPAASHVVLVDVPGTDPGSLRRLITRLTPAWWGRTPLELELDTDPDAWFTVGLREYLAYVLPFRTGLSRRDPVPAIENSWVSQPELRAIDLRSPTDGARNSQYARRLVSMGLLHELDLALDGGLLSFLAGFGGRGFPRGLESGPAAATFAELLARRIERGERRLSFEPDWDLRFDPAPIEREPGTRIARALTFAYSADTRGYLETCGCKAAQAGGIARRAGVLAGWRAASPDLVLVDLGNFSALAHAEAGLDPAVAEEQALYPVLFERLGYDAVVLGPDEVYSGSVALAPGRGDDGRITGTAWLGAGLEIDGRPAGPDARVIEREGLTIGIVGHSELLENAHARQAQEVHTAGIDFPRSPPLETLRRLRPQVDLLVVAGRMGPASLRRLAEPSLGVDLVLCAGHVAAMDLGAAGFLGRTAVAFDQVGTFGAQRVDLFLSDQGRVVSLRHGAVQLSPQVPDDPAVRELLDEFYSSSVVAAAEVQPLFESDPWQRGPYVGSQRCATCHVDEHRAWQATDHATAMRTLEAARRERNPSCVKCHVVGLGTESGYSIGRPDPALGAVGCETCHGAGERHAERPSRDNIRRTPDQGTCVACHDAKHSEAFLERFDDAWETVLHR